MLTLEEAIKQYEQFVNVCENHNQTEESQEVIEQLATELRELQEFKKADSCEEGYVKEFNKRYLLVIKQLAAWLKELKERRKEPKIIRCGECEHKGTRNCVANTWATIFGYEVKDDFYCGLAERRTE